jgi:hypothetical protein
MKVVWEKVEEDLVITEDTLFLGIAVGSARVAKGTTLEMQGIILGDVILDPGSRVLMDGIVYGDVVNDGGRLECFGIVHGEIRSDPGACVLHPVKRRLREIRCPGTVQAVPQDGDGPRDETQAFRFHRGKKPSVDIESLMDPDGARGKS